jgi:cation diffusion facilitator family transporter
LGSSDLAVERAEVKIDELYKRSGKAALWGLAVGLSLGAAKLMGGLLGHSIALLADSVHSFGDAIVAGVVLAALRWSQLPPDREHPYGHTRAEAVAGSNVALLLVFSGVAIIWQALYTLSEPSPEPEPFALYIAAVSVVLKEALYRHQTGVARQTGSSTVRAAAWDHRADAFASLAVLGALLLIKWGGPTYHAADHYAAVVVGVTVVWAGGRLFWQSLQELLDRQADPGLLTSVRHEALTVPGVRDVEKLLVRKTGLEYLVDIHVEVDPNISVRDGHAIAHAVKDRLIGRIVPVKDVLVHVEPSPEHQDRAQG